MLENIQKGDICIFQNGEEAIVTSYIINFAKENTIKLFFNHAVCGKGNNVSEDWNYHINGTWLGGGNNIAKVIHQ